MKIDILKVLGVIVTLILAGGTGYGVFLAMDQRLTQAELKMANAEIKMEDWQKEFMSTVREFAKEMQADRQRMIRVEADVSWLRDAWEKR